MTWKMVVCPVCDKIDYDDERHQIGSHYPAFLAQMNIVC